MSIVIRQSGEMFRNNILIDAGIAVAALMFEVFIILVLKIIATKIKKKLIGIIY